MKKCHTRILTCDSVTHSCEYHLILSCNGIATAVGVNLSTTHVGNIVFGSHCLIIHFVGVGVGQIYTLCPVGFYGDGCHAFGHVEVCALVEYTRTIAVLVLIGAVAVGEVEGGEGDFARSVGCGISTR